MADTHVTLTGNLTDDPDLRYTPNGTEVANFRLAVTAHQGRRHLARRRDLLLPHQRLAAAGRARRRVPDQGRPGRGHRPAQVRSWETPRATRSVVEVEADESPPCVGGQARAAPTSKGSSTTSPCHRGLYRRGRPLQATPPPPPPPPRRPTLGDDGPDESTATRRQTARHPGPSPAGGGLG